MNNEPLNTQPIETFLQLVKSADNSNQKEVRIDIKQAKNLAFVLGAVMARMNGSLEQMMDEIQKTQTITVSMDGGSEW